MNDDYGARADHAKSQVRRGERIAKELMAWTWFFGFVGLGMASLAAVFHPFLSVFAFFSGYGASQAWKMRRETVTSLSYWKEEHFLWASAQGFETGESIATHK